MLVYKSLHLFALVCLLACSGCATYQGKVSVSRNLLKQGRLSEAIETLKPLAETPSDDQLVYLMDYGAALQIAGEFKESNKALLAADKLSDRQDYHSVSRIALATLGSEEMIQYKGETYEKLLINAMLAINFLMLNQPDEALVEAKRINEKINKIRLDGRKDYEQNSFAHYLSAIIWESQKKYDDAYIEFEEAYKIDPSNPLLHADLIRTAKLSRRMDSYKKWKSEFPDIKEDNKWYDKSLGELVVIIQQGWGPEKRFSPQDVRFPILVPTHSETLFARVFISGQPEIQSQPIYDIEATSMQTLEADYKWMALRKIGAFIAKDAVADKISEKDKALGFIAWMVMHGSDRADLRQWSTLPKTIQFVRLKLKPGEYKLKLQGYNASGVATADTLEETSIQIKAGAIKFLNWRPLR